MTDPLTLGIGFVVCVLIGKLIGYFLGRKHEADLWADAAIEDSQFGRTTLPHRGREYAVLTIEDYNLLRARATLRSGRNTMRAMTAND